jgi:hypothetical protein
MKKLEGLTSLLIIKYACWDSRKLLGKFEFNITVVASFPFLKEKP